MSLDVAAASVGAFEQVTREKVLALEDKMESTLAPISEELRGLWKAVDGLRSDVQRRLPAWYTFVLSGSWALIGAMLTYILDHLLK